MMGKPESLRGQSQRRRWLRWSLLATLGLGAALGGASCGGTAGSRTPLLQSNTNWLQRCGPDVPCSGALICLCGMCSQPCSESTECGRLEGASCGGSCGDAAPAGATAPAGGMCVLGCSSDDECGADFTCQASECRPRPAELDEQTLGDPRVDTVGTCSNTFISLDDVLSHASRDVAGQDASDQPFLRYVSFANRNDAGVCAAELETERLALTKALNSTSQRATITAPTPIDADRLIYRIDLRDYGWDTPRTLNGVDYANVWDLLVTSSPYGVALEGDDAGLLASDTGTAVPLLPADAVIHGAARGDEYMSLLQLPQTLNELFDTLGIDPDANRRDGEARRVGTNQSRISRATRILERHELEVRAGVLWMSYDFLSEFDLFSDPLAVDADGGTVIFSLPNGLPGFALYDRDGLLEPSTDILLDTNQNDFRAQTAVSCMNCHTDTVLPVADEVRSMLDIHPERFPLEGRAEIQQLYPGADILRDQMASDNARFRTAIERLGVPRDTADPVATLVYRFERDLTPSEMAGELMLPADRFEANKAQLGIDAVLTREAFERGFSARLCASLVDALNRPAACSGP